MGEGFHKLPRFLEEPGGHLLMTPDGLVIDIGPQYLRMTLTNRETVIGHPFTTIFPEATPNQIAQLVESIRKVRKTGETDKLGVQRFERKRSPELGRERSLQWWQITHIPIVDSSGNVVQIVQRIEDQTLLMTTSEAINKQRISNYVLYGFTILLVGIILYVSFNANDKFNGINKKTCQVQAAGLPAQHELSASMQDIDKLITYKPPNPPPEPPYITNALQDLQKHLDNYVKTTAKQPSSRKC